MNIVLKMQELIVLWDRESYFTVTSVDSVIDLKQKNHDYCKNILFIQVYLHVITEKHKNILLETKM
jgi:hypothetical protein